MVVSVFWAAIWLPVVTGGLGSLAAEVLLYPKPQVFYKRSLRAVTIHAGLWLVLVAAELLVWRRPIFAVFNVLALELLIILVSNVKFHTLREQFIVQDFDYFIDLIRHPMLYIPFLGFFRAFISAAAFCCSIWIAIVFESSLFNQVSVINFFLNTILLALAGIFLLWFGDREKPSLTWNPTDDVYQLGLAACLWHYGMAERRSHNEPLPDSPFTLPSQVIKKSLSPIVVVQSESFFDPRRYFPGIRKEILQRYDSLCSSALLSGQLKVPVWGANTVRTEFAFLSGLVEETLGVHRFNPYRGFARRGIPTIANFLKQAGYRTVCVHPYPANFYSRDVVFPILGFDEFIDIAAFQDAPRCGMYVKDTAIADKVCSLLDEQINAPLFVFVITMENHGPLDLEDVSKEEAMSLYNGEPPDGCKDLIAYLRHLANADQMVGRLHNRLQQFPDAWFCMYGDHVPIMPNVYRQLGAPSGMTDYVLWRSEQSTHIGSIVDEKVERLGIEMLRHMGIINGR